MVLARHVRMVKMRADSAVSVGRRRRVANISVVVGVGKIGLNSINNEEMGHATAEN